MASLLKYWNLLAGRYGAMSKRERLAILAAGIALAYAIANGLLVSPLLDRQRHAAQELAQRQSSLKQMREQVEMLTRARAVDPDAAYRARLDRNRQRLTELEAEIEKQSAQLIAPQRMRGVLEKLLASRPRLQMTELKTLPRRIVALPSEARPGTAARGKPAGGEPDTGGLLYQHSFELTLKGAYLDLLAYLSEIEALPDRLYWDRLELSAREYPIVTLKLTLYTVSLDRAWLLV